MSETRPSWTQPLCVTCWAAWTLGRGEPLTEPVRVTGGSDLCCVCGESTDIYVRIDPELTAPLIFARTE